MIWLAGFVQITAQRTLLVARERVVAVNREIQRLHAWSQCVIAPPPPISREMRGMMVIDNITIHLNKNFCQRAVDNSQFMNVQLLGLL